MIGGGPSAVVGSRIGTGCRSRVPRAYWILGLAFQNVTESCGFTHPLHQHQPCIGETW